MFSINPNNVTYSNLYFACEFFDGFQFGKFGLTTTWQHENLDHSNLNPNLESKQTPDNILTPSSLDNFRAQHHRSTQAWFDDEQCRGCAGVVWTCEVAVAESANANLPPIQIGFVHAIFQLLVCYICCNIIQQLQDNFLGTTFESVGSVSMWLYCSYWAKCIRPAAADCRSRSASSRRTRRVLGPEIYFFWIRGTMGKFQLTWHSKLLCTAAHTSNSIVP